MLCVSLTDDPLNKLHKILTSSYPVNTVLIDCNTIRIFAILALVFFIKPARGKEEL